MQAALSADAVAVAALWGAFPRDDVLAPGPPFALTEINPAIGDKFDPEKHQAMSAQDSAEVPPNHVLMVLQKGYLLNNRLLRPALVIVAKASAEAPEA